MQATNDEPVLKGIFGQSQENLRDLTIIKSEYLVDTTKIKYILHTQVEW